MILIETFESFQRTFNAVDHYDTCKIPNWKQLQPQQCSLHTDLALTLQNHYEEQCRQITSLICGVLNQRSSLPIERNTNGFRSKSYCFARSAQLLYKVDSGNASIYLCGAYVFSLPGSLTSV